MFGPEAKIHAANRDPPQLENEEALVSEMRLKLGPAADAQLLLHHVRSARGKLHWACNSYFREIFFSASPSYTNPITPAQGTCTMQSQGSRLDFLLLHVLPHPEPARDHTSSQAGPSADTPNALLLHAHLIAQAGGSTHLPQPHAPPGAAQAKEHRQQPSCVVPILSDSPATFMSTSGDAALSCSASLNDVPGSLLELVVSHLDAWSLCQVSRVNRAFRKAASSNAVWQQLFIRSWGQVVFPTDPPSVQSPSQQQQQQQQQQQLLQHSQGAASYFASQPASPHALSQDLPGATALTASGAEEASPSGSALIMPPAGAAVQDLPFSQQQQQQPGSSDVCWRGLFKKQSLLAHAMCCPRCGDGRVVPILYGFPSKFLMDAMKSKQLILGGDHLIENCHVWACTLCNSSFRTYPYLRPELWVDELAERQRQRLQGPHDGLMPYTYEL